MQEMGEGVERMKILLLIGGMLNVIVGLCLMFVRDSTNGTSQLVVGFSLIILAKLHEMGEK